MQDSPNVNFTGPLFRSGPYDLVPPGPPANPGGLIMIIVTPATTVTDKDLRSRLPLTPYRVNDSTVLDSVSLTLDAGGATVSASVTVTFSFLIWAFSIGLGYTLRFSVVPSWSMRDKEQVCRVVPSGPGTLTGAWAFLLASYEPDIRSRVVGAMESNLNAGLIKTAASAFNRSTLPSGAILSMRQVVHQANAVVFFPSLAAFGQIDLSVQPGEDPRCAQIPSDIAARRLAVDELKNEAAGLNPRIPDDRRRLREIRAEIGRLENEIAALEQQAATLGCA